MTFRKLALAVAGVSFAALAAAAGLLGPDAFRGALQNLLGACRACGCCSRSMPVSLRVTMSCTLRGKSQAAA